MQQEVHERREADETDAEVIARDGEGDEPAEIPQMDDGGKNKEDKEVGFSKGGELSAAPQENSKGDHHGKSVEFIAPWSSSGGKHCGNEEGNKLGAATVGYKGGLGR